MEEPPPKRTRRLNQMVITNKNPTEAVKRKIPLKVIKPTSLNEKKKLVLRNKDEKKPKTSTKVKPKESAGKIKPKKKSGKVGVKATGKRTNLKQDENSSGHDDVSAEESSTAEKAEPSVEEMKANNEEEDEFESASSGDELSNDEDSSHSTEVVNSRDAKPQSAAGNIEPKEALTGTSNTDEKKKATSTDVKPEEVPGKIKPNKKSGKVEVKAAAKRSHLKQDEDSNGHDDVSVEESYTADIIEPKEGDGMEKVKARGDEVSSDEDSMEVVNSRVVKPRNAADNINPKKPLTGTINKVEKKQKTSTDVKPKESAGRIKPLKKSSKLELKATAKQSNRKPDENSSGHDDGSAEESSTADNVEPGMAEVKVNNEKAEEFEKVSSGNELSDDDEDSMEVENSRVVEPKSAADNINPKKALTGTNKEDKKKEISTAVKPKESAGKIKTKKKSGKLEVKAPAKQANRKPHENSSGHDDVSAEESATAKNEVKSTDEKENEMGTDKNNALQSASKQIDANQHSNEGRIFKIVSRIENKLDGFVSERINEKRMFAIILRMPFDRLEDINQYNLDLEDVVLYLKFAKYFECVGGNTDGKIVCNILHLIATPNLLSQFEWQISSSKSFQALKNIVKLIHAAAKGVCSEKYNLTVCGEVIKNTLRNARGGAYKK